MQLRPLLEAACLGLHGALLVLLMLWWGVSRAWVEAGSSRALGKGRGAIRAAYVGVTCVPTLALPLAHSDLGRGRPSS